MSKKKPAALSATEDFWKSRLYSLGRNIIFIDTSAILEALDPDDEIITPYLEGLDSRLITSTYVVHETARRVVKDRQAKFKGPDGRRLKELAVYFLNRWLADNDVEVIYLPDCFFSEVRKTFEEKKGIDCDLTDISSYLVVQGIEQDRIITLDKNDFSRLGLLCEP